MQLYVQFKQELVVNQASQLSLEQEFSLRSFADRARNLSREQAQNLLIELGGQMMIKNNFYKQLLEPYMDVGSSASGKGVGSDSFVS